MSYLLQRFLIKRPLTICLQTHIYRYMAGHKDIKGENERKRALEDPLLKEIFARAGYPKSFVVITEGMTPEEEEMDICAGFLKEGYPLEESERKAKEWVRVMNSF